MTIFFRVSSLSFCAMMLYFIFDPNIYCWFRAKHQFKEINLNLRSISYASWTWLLTFLTFQLAFVNGMTNKILNTCNILTFSYNFFIGKYSSPNVKEGNGLLSFISVAMKLCKTCISALMRFISQFFFSKISQKWSLSILTSCHHKVFKIFFWSSFCFDQINQIFKHWIIFMICKSRSYAVSYSYNSFALIFLDSRKIYIVFR